MSRIPADFTPLGYHSDPVNGDSTAIAAEVTHLRATATKVREAHDGLQRIIRGSNQSQRLDTIQSQVSAVAGKLELVVARYNGTAAALDAYRATLEPIQLKADQLARDAAGDHATDVNNFDDSVALHRQILSSTDPAQITSLQSEYDDVEARRRTARANVASAKAALRGLIDERKAAAEHTAHTITSALDASGLNDTLIDHFNKGLETARQFLIDQSETLSKIGEVIGWVGFAVSLLAIVFPPLAVVALVINGIGAAFKVVGALGKALKDGNWGAFVLTAGIAAISILGAAKGLKAVGKIATAGKGMSVWKAMDTFGRGKGLLTNVAGHSTAKVKALVKGVIGHTTPFGSRVSKAGQLAKDVGPALKDAVRKGAGEFFHKVGLSAPSASQAARATVDLALKADKLVKLFGEAASIVVGPPTGRSQGSCTQRTFVAVAA